MADGNTTDGRTLAKAQLIELTSDLKGEKSGGKTLVVQFNPETLKISFANQVQQPEGAGDQRGTAAQNFAGAGTTKLTCTLWFDVNAPQPKQPGNGGDAKDVRTLTTRVSYFITAKADEKDKQHKAFIPPGVRFSWGSLTFEGLMDSVEESLEFFSPEGRPLRASVAISISQQKVIIFPPKDLADGPKKKPGTSPTTPVPEGSSVQKVAGPNWQGMAAANGVENPRLPQPGFRLDLSLSNR